MSITLYPVPGTEFYIDEMYSMCDREGTLYAYNGYTITFNDYLYPLGGSLHRRSEGPAYGDTPLPTTMPEWREMQKTWIDPTNLEEYGVKDSFAYKHTMLGIVENAPGLGPAGPMLFCKSEWAQRNKKPLTASPLRSNFVDPINMNKRMFVPRSLPTRSPPPFMFRGLRA